MQSFYLRIPYRAVLIGDRDLIISQYESDPPGVYTLEAKKIDFSDEYGDATTIFEGGLQQCERLLDWILEASLVISMKENSCPFVDARHFIADLEGDCPVGTSAIQSQNDLYQFKSFMEKVWNKTKSDGPAV